MLTLKDYVNWGITHSDKTGSAEGVPLVMENCVKNKKMKQLEVYGNSFQDGTPSPENPIEVESVGEFDADVGKYKVPVVVKGKNLVDLSEFVSRGNMKLNDASTGEYEFINPSNMPRLYIDFDYDDYYVIKCEVMAIKEQDIKMTAIDSSGSAIINAGFSIAGVVGEWITATRVIPKDSIPNISYYVFGGAGGLGTGTKIRGFQIERGSLATEYEPYTEPITTNVYLNEPLRKIGDYADYIDGKGKKAVRQIKQFSNFAKAIVYKYTSFDYTNVYRFSLSDALDTSKKDVQSDKPYVICNLLPYGGYVCRNNKESIGYSEGHLVYFRFEGENDYGITDVSSFRNWYNQANPLLYYILHEPTEEPIECELPKLNAKTSIVEIDTALLPSNIKGKYIKR